MATSNLETFAYTMQGSCELTDAEGDTVIETFNEEPAGDIAAAKAEALALAHAPRPEIALSGRPAQCGIAGTGTRGFNPAGRRVCNDLSICPP